MDFTKPPLRLRYSMGTGVFYTYDISSYLVTYLMIKGKNDY